MDRNKFVNDFNSFNSDFQEEYYARNNGILTHYTSMSTAKKIIRSKTLRLTQCGKANDYEEGYYIYRILFDAVYKINNKGFRDSIVYYFQIKNKIELVEKDVYDRELTDNSEKLDLFIKREKKDWNNLSIFKDTYKESKNHYFQVCFSMNEDSTAMWKYYAKGRKNDKGCNIQFYQEDFSHVLIMKYAEILMQNVVFANAYTIMTNK